MAFINSFAPSVRFSTYTFGPSVSSKRPSTYNRSNISYVTPVMKVDIADKVRQSRSSYTYTEAARNAKEQAVVVPQRGFTEYAELLNGRLAQLGFVTGLVTELITGKGINEQLMILFSPITHLITILAK